MGKVGKYTPKQCRRAFQDAIRSDRSYVLRINHEVAREVAAIVAADWPKGGDDEGYGGNQHGFSRSVRIRAKRELRESRPQMSPLAWWLVWQVAKMVIARLIKKYWGPKDQPAFFVSD